MRWRSSSRKRGRARRQRVERPDYDFHMHVCVASDAPALRVFECAPLDAPAMPSRELFLDRLQEIVCPRCGGPLHHASCPCGTSIPEKWRKRLTELFAEFPDGNWCAACGSGWGPVEIEPFDSEPPGPLN